LPLVDLIIGTGRQNPVFPDYLGAIDQCFIAPANRVVMHERQVDHIELVFNAPRIVGVPVIFNLTEDVRVIDVIVKKRQGTRDFIFITIPQVDNAISFPDRILQDMVAADIGNRCFAVGGNECALTILVKLESMEGTLDAVTPDLPQAERGPAMGALVHNAAKLAFAVSKEGQVQVQPFNGDDLASFDFF